MSMSTNPCDVCMSTEILEDGGKYICVDCGAERGAYITGDAVTSEISQKKGVQAEEMIETPKETNTDKEVDDWNPCEGFDVILRHWVEVLSDIISEPAYFKTLVSKLWFRYLRKGNIAFSDEIDFASGLFSKRRKLAIDGCKASKAESSWKLFKKAQWKKARLNKNTEVSTKRGTTILSTYIKNQTEDLRDILDDTNFFEKESSGETNNDTAHLLRLNLHAILTILYLAILICEEDILLLDLIRWAREQYLPFRSAMHLVTHCPVGKYYCEDFSQFTDSAHKYRLRAGEFAALLGIESLPLPGFKKCLRRIVRALKLPRSIVNLALSFILSDKHSSKDMRQLEAPAVEVTCVAAILLVFKLHFGLDDCHADYLDRCATLIDRQLGDKKLDLFVFSKWQCYINKVLWWSTKVTLDHQSFPGLISEMDLKRLHQHYCCDGVLRKVHRQNYSELVSSEVLINAIGEEVGLQFPNKKPDPLFPMYWDPITGIVDSYIQHGYANDKGKDKTQVLKIAEELSSVTFENCLFDWVQQKRLVEQAFTSVNKKVKIVHRSLAFDEPIDLSSKSSTIVLPNPASSYLRTTFHTTDQIPEAMSIKESPVDFMWLTNVLARICETENNDVLLTFRTLERSIMIDPRSNGLCERI